MLILIIQTRLAYPRFSVLAFFIELLINDLKLLNYR
jgi:hypothetical protein